MIGDSLIPEINDNQKSNLFIDPKEKESTVGIESKNTALLLASRRRDRQNPAPNPPVWIESGRRFLAENPLADGDSNTFLDSTKDAMTPLATNAGDSLDELYAFPQLLDETLDQL